MKRRIFIGTAAIAVLMTFLVGYLATVRINNASERAIQQNLMTNAKIIAAEQDEASMRHAADAVAEASGMNVTLILKDGTVWYRQPALPDGSEEQNHLEREEVKQAFETGTGTAQRHSATMDKTLSYAAVATEDGSMVVRMSVQVDEILAANRQTAWEIFFLLSVCLAGLLVLAWRMTTVILAPINEITAVAKEYADGQYGRKIRTNYRNEMGVLAHAFNSMSTALVETNETLAADNGKLQAIMEAMTNGVVAVDSDLKVIMTNSAARQVLGIGWSAVGQSLFVATGKQELESFFKRTLEGTNKISEEITLSYGFGVTRQKKILRIRGSRLRQNGTTTGAVAVLEDVTELKRLENIRTEFAANVSHELKTPLTSIKGFVETLESGVDDPEHAKRFLHIISSETDRLTRLISDILYVSELESYRQSVPEIVDVLQKASDVVELLSKNAQKKRIDLTLEQDPNHSAFCMGDGDKVQQMLMNLVANGINYTPEGGQVKIQLSSDEKQVKIVVSDTGIGIAEKDISRLFERFYRVDKGRSRATGGTGLGLAIVKHVVMSMKGDIQVKSEVGKGSSFIVTLPKADKTEA